MYKKVLPLICFIFLYSMPNSEIFANALVGQISKEDIKINRPQIVDATTNLPVVGAKIAIPKENKASFSDKNGFFTLNSDFNGPIILSVKKDGYKPFSITVKNDIFSNPIMLKIEKNSPNNITLSSELLHLGDNSFSENSSGACLINAPCVGPEFSKSFYVKDITKNAKAYVEIGSIVGIDTIQAMKLGQNNLTNATSSPLELFVNKHKIGELKINGDMQRIPIPIRILNKSSDNLLTLKTGINKSKTDFIDYDDVELMNISVILDD